MLSAPSRQPFLDRIVQMEFLLFSDNDIVISTQQKRHAWQYETSRTEPEHEHVSSLFAFESSGCRSETILRILVPSSPDVLHLAIIAETRNDPSASV